ncbi:MAG: FHA domain-containing protein [Myxococcota bacterium]
MPKFQALTVGSDPECDIQLNIPNISRKHLSILSIGHEQFEINDLGSFGGTYYNGRRITKAVVSANDVIQIGHTPVRVAQLARQYFEQTLNEEIEQGTVMMKMVSMTIGREPPAQFILEYPFVSRRHCEIRLSPQGLLIRDLNSSNGTFINNAPISDWTPLKKEDELALGSFKVPNSIRERWFIQLSSTQDRDLIYRYEGELPDNGVLIIGRSAESQIRIEHPTVSAQHAELTIRDGNLFITDLGSENGTYINGVPIGSKTAFTFQDPLNIGQMKLLLPLKTLKGVNANIQVQVDVRNVGRTLHNGLTILNEISLSVYPGEIVALMGPSGAGKTSLLEVLTGKITPTSGSVCFNNEDLHSHFDRLSSAMGYVPQQDLVHSDLTVFEELMFAAKMRLPPNTPSAVLQNQVQRILTEIGLAHIRDSIIGDEMRRGISGGQRKRVNIAIELLTEPAVLFLDEPTSGLDATSTLEVLHTLRTLADAGKTIIMTIHQPRVEAFHIMDNLILLAKGGHLAYYGPTKKESVNFVSRVSGRQMKMGVNPADFVVDSLENPAQPMAPEAWSAAYRTSKIFAKFVAERQQQKHSKSEGDIHLAQRPSYLQQSFILLTRYFTRKKRDKTALLVQGLQALVIGLLLSVLFFNQGSDLQEMEIKPALEKIPMIIRFLQLDNGIHPTLFLIAASAFWLGCNNVAREVVSARPILSRERRSGLNTPAYLTSVYGAQMLIAILQMSIIVGFVWIFVRPTSNIVLPFIISLLTSSVGISTGLLISSSARSEVSAISTVPIVLIPQLLLGGYIKIYGRLQLDTFQHMAADCMPIRWSFEALTTVEYAKVREYNTSLHNIGSTIGFENGVGLPCTVLLSMTVLLLIGSWFQLRRSL